MLVAENLRKRYGSTHALAGFSLTVEPAEIVGLIGHNGAGKTTFVEITAGLVRPDAGRVTIAGIDPARAPAAARSRLGLAPQQLALYPTATVAANLRLFGALAGLRRRALRTAIDETADALGLTGMLHRPVAVLSGGQQRRAQAATALLHRPAVLLLDEPTVGADLETRQALLALVRRRAADGTAICYTTHYLPELADLGATIAVAAAGRVIARGDQDTLLAGLPGTVRLTFGGPVPGVLAARPGAAVDGAKLVLRGTDPAAVLAAALRELDAVPHPPVTAVDIARPDLADLYESLREVPHAA
jgi:ABC-2 type transport system ATP-binding protein